MTISRRIRWMACAACCAMSGCSLAPPGPAPAAALTDACVERSVARQEQVEKILGRDAPVTRRDDPLAPANIAANAAQNELLNCLRTSAD